MGSLSVLLTTEGTYPYSKGGVSTWCDSLTRELAEVDFTLLTLTVHPYVNMSYALRPNVQRLITVPLWGIEQPAEFRFEGPFSEVLEKQARTTDQVIADHFVPPFREILRGIGDASMPVEAVGRSLVALHDYFQQFDYHVTFRSQQVWDVMLAACAERRLRTIAAVAPPTLADVLGAFRLLYHLLQPLNVALPQFDVVHSSAAAFCGLPCIVAKLKHNTPFLLTEHGVYVREQYLALRRWAKSPYIHQFMCSLVSLVAMVNYHYADMVSPVCAYNARWERWWGVPADRIRVILNGADPVQFSPAEVRRSHRPIVSTMGLIYPLKGQLDLIAAAAHVRDVFPDVQFRVYGAASDEAYFDACRNSVAAKGLKDTVHFAGQTSTPWHAYREADVVAMASVSEAFPYSIIEAMLSGAAIVATDVGGVREAIADTGVVVPPRQPRELAAALIAMLNAPARRRSLGQAARERAVRHFTVQTFAASYRQAYDDLRSRGLSQLAAAS